MTPAPVYAERAWQRWCAAPLLPHGTYAEHWQALVAEQVAAAQAEALAATPACACSAPTAAHVGVCPCGPADACPVCIVTDGTAS